MRGFALVLLLLCPLAMAQERLRIGGSSTMAPLVAELARQYQQTHPRVQIEVRAGGTPAGIQALRDGQLDIALAGRALHADEADLFAITIARDGVALVVHASNPLRALSADQARAVLSGRVTNWKALGGRDAAIDLVARPVNYSSMEVVGEHFKLKPQEIKAASVAADNNEALQAVTTRPLCLTFFSVGLAERQAARGAAVAPLAIDGVPASSRNVSLGTYSLVRPLNLITRKVPSGLARQFIEYALSPAVNATIEQFEFVPFTH